MTDRGVSRTGIGEGSGRRWRGAGGPGGRGGMFEGSEGPERATGGRYEQRQTRQVLSALFWHFFWQNPAPWRRSGSNASAETGVAGRRRRAHSWTHRTASGPRTLNAAIWPAPGPSPRLGHPRDADVVQHGMVLGTVRGGTCGLGGRGVRGVDSAAARSYIERAANWGRGEGGYRAGLSSRRPRVQVPSLPSSYQVLRSSKIYGLWRSG